MENIDYEFKRVFVHGTAFFYVAIIAQIEVFVLWFLELPALYFSDGTVKIFYHAAVQLLVEAAGNLLDKFFFVKGNCVFGAALAFKELGWSYVKGVCDCIDGLGFGENVAAFYFGNVAAAVAYFFGKLLLR